MDVDSEESDKTEVQVRNSLGVMNKIAALYTGRLMSDITLLVNGVEFPAHRLILCASSDVFSVMLMNPIWNEAKENRVVLTESIGCTQVFEQFLKYLYTGEVKLMITSVINLLQLSDKYNVKDLIVLCVEYMEEHIPAAASKSQLIHWYQYTVICGHHILSKMCKNFIKWNFDSIARADDFCCLEAEQMCDILIEDDIVVTDEYTLYCYMDFWIECQKPRFPNTMDGQANLLELVEHTLSLIRFPMISPRQLADLLLIPLTQKYKDFLMEQMSISMVFHSGSGATEKLSKLLEAHPFRSKLFTPRLYWTSDWGVCLAIDSFSHFNHYQSKTLVFSTPLSFCERSFEKQTEWVVDFYPKGVCFKKHLLIVWEGTRECPEHVLQTVRLAVHCKNEGVEPVRVQISILVTGEQDGVEHTRSVYKRRVVFSSRDKIVNIDNILPYEELVPSVLRCPRNGTNGSSRPFCSHTTTPAASTASGTAGPASNTCPSFFQRKSCYLTGESKDILKVRILITPTCEFGF